MNIVCCTGQYTYNEYAKVGEMGTAATESAVVHDGCGTAVGGPADRVKVPRRTASSAGVNLKEQ